LLLLPCCRRLCPADKSGKRRFAAVMMGRLQRLGIDKTDPDDLTPEEVRGSAAAAAAAAAACGAVCQARLQCNPWNC
jgi:hypothetical protein